MHFVSSTSFWISALLLATVTEGTVVHPNGKLAQNGLRRQERDKLHLRLAARQVGTLIPTLDVTGRVPLGVASSSTANVLAASASDATSLARAPLATPSNLPQHAPLDDAEDGDGGFFSSSAAIGRQSLNPKATMTASDSNPTTNGERVPLVTTGLLTNSRVPLASSSDVVTDTGDSSTSATDTWTQDSPTSSSTFVSFEPLPSTITRVNPKMTAYSASTVSSSQMVFSSSSTSDDTTDAVNDASPSITASASVARNSIATPSSSSDEESVSRSPLPTTSDTASAASSSEVVSVVTESSVFVTIVDGTPTSTTSTGRSTSTHFVIVTADASDVLSAESVAPTAEATTTDASVFGVPVAAGASNTSAADRLECTALVAILAVVIGALMLS